MELGQKAKCKGYIKKTGNWICDEMDFDKRLNEEEVKKLREDTEYHEIDRFVAMINWKPKRINCDEKIAVKEIANKEFEGIIVGKKTVNLSIYATVGYMQNGDDFEYVSKGDFIDCYKVYYSFGKSRLVPFNLCEVN